MGASAWWAATPYLDDLAEALASAQREAYASSRLYDPRGIATRPDAAIARLEAELAALRPDLDEGLRESVVDELTSTIAAIRAYTAARSTDARIEALRRATGFEGTHSILDLPSVDALDALPESEIVRRFGTPRPALDAVRRAVPELAEHVTARFRAVWLVAEDDGRVVLCFVGVSGD